MPFGWNIIFTPLVAVMVKMSPDLLRVEMLPTGEYYKSRIPSNVTSSKESQLSQYRLPARPLG